MKQNTLLDKLLSIQTELHVPKGQKNKFGNYSYRSAEDILEAIKPLSKKHNVLFKINEKIVEIKGEVALISTVKVFDLDDQPNAIETDAVAFVDFFAKGMQRPQQTGSASSYGKKYALGNLLLIDDTKDPDAINDHKTDEMDENHEKWQQIVNWVKVNKDLNKVKAKYKLSKDAEVKLQQLVNQ